MVEPLTLLVGISAAIAVLLVLGFLVRRWRGPSITESASARQSRESHERAQERSPPVDIGEVRKLGISEFTDHHSGERQAVGKVEGFVIFVEDVPDSVDQSDVIRARILSFNRNETSANATYLDTV